MLTQHPIRQMEEWCFKSWAEALPNFIKDGAVDPVAFCKVDTRIVFLYKEVNNRGDGPKSWSLHEYLKRGDDTDSRMWTKTARWIHGILYGKIEWDDKHKDLPFLEGFQDIKDFRSKMLKQVAVVNINKAGGKEESDMAVVERHAVQFKKHLNMQIFTYVPDLIIAGGIPDQILVNLFDLELRDMINYGDGLKFWHIEEYNCRLIKYYHPAFLMNHRKMYETVVDAVKEIR